MATPEYSANQGTPSAAPKGAATDVNTAMAEIPDVDTSNVEEPVEFPQDEIDDTVPPMEGDLTGLDNLVFAETDRPQEPITSGAPFGEGPMGTGDDFTPRQHMENIAYKLAEDPLTSSSTKAYMSKILRGD